MFNDPIENLSVEDVCNILSDTMSNCLVDGARQAGAVGPISCGVVLLPGALESVRRRLFYEQAIHELKKMLVNILYRAIILNWWFLKIFI